MRFRTSLVLPAICLLIHSSFPGAATADYNPIDRAKPTVGQGADGSSSSGQISSSSDGRYLAFASAASNYITNDDNGVSDIYVLDRTNGDIERISVNAGGVEADGASMSPAISADGRYVVFESVATNLIPNDSNDASDVFLVDRDNDTIERVSITYVGGQSNGDSFDPAISDDGTIIAFSSGATNLVVGDSNDAQDIFVFDTSDDSVTRASNNTAGTQLSGDSHSAALSSDGRYLAYSSDADDVVPGDNNDVRDVFLHDRDDAPSVERVSVSSNGDEGNGASDNPALSDDGQILAFDSVATNLVLSDGNEASDVFVRDIAADETELVSAKSATPVLRAVTEGDGASFQPSLDGSGRYVAFHSDASNFANLDTNEVTDVFIRDRTDKKITRVSVTALGAEVSEASMAASLNGNTNFLAYLSAATDIIENTSEGSHEVYVVNLQCLIAAQGVVAVDSDGDATDDCSDDCPTDSAKTVVGVCGCGVADTDSDGDGTEDCLDECSADSAKTVPGTCGCGVADTDTTGTGLPDCLDPTSSTVPARPLVRRVQGRSHNMLVRIPPQFKGLKYRVTVRRRGGGVVGKSTKRGRKFKFRVGAGRYRIHYKVSLPGGGFSKRSERVNFLLR